MKPRLHRQPPARCGPSRGTPRPSGDQCRTLRPRMRRGRRTRSDSAMRREAAQVFRQHLRASLGSNSPRPSCGLGHAGSAVARRGHLVPGAIRRATVRRVFDRTPPHCLKKNATPSSTQRSRSSRIHSIAHGAMTRAGLAAGDEPVDAGKVQPFERPEQRLGGDEPHSAPGPPQAVGAVDEAPILDPHSHPDVRMPGQAGASVGQPLVALGQDLEGVPVRPVP